MDSAASRSILVERYARYPAENVRRYSFNPDTGALSPAEVCTSEVSGWLVELERVIDGEKRVIFFRDKHRRCVALGARTFEIGPRRCTVSHKKGCLFSQLIIVDEAGYRHSVKYVTPWWRLVFDDGMFPELQFPLKEFAKQISADGTDAPGRRGYLQNDGS